MYTSYFLFSTDSKDSQWGLFSELIVPVKLSKTRNEHDDHFYSEDGIRHGSKTFQQSSKRSFFLNFFYFCHFWLTSAYYELKIVITLIIFIEDTSVL